MSNTIEINGKSYKAEYGMPEKDQLYWSHGIQKATWDWENIKVLILEEIPAEPEWTPEIGEVVELFGYGNRPEYLAGLYILGERDTAKIASKCYYLHSLDGRDIEGHAEISHIRPAVPTEVVPMQDRPEKSCETCYWAIGETDCGYDGQCYAGKDGRWQGYKPKEPAPEPRKIEPLYCIEHGDTLPLLYKINEIAQVLNQHINGGQE